MELQWRAADADVRPLVWGFVERRDPAQRGVASHFPVAYPHLQVMLDGAFRVELGGRRRSISSAALWGSTFDMCSVTSQGNLHAFVAALTFEGAALLLGGPPQLIAGQIVDLEALPPLASTALVEQLMEAGSFARRVQLVQEFFRALARENSVRNTDARLLRLGTAIATDAFCGSVGAAARLSGLSERTLYNRFQHEIGCAPKRLLRLARLHRLLRTLHPAPFGGKPQADPLLEFTDEAHMHREFVAMTGLRPREFVAAKRTSGDHLFQSVRIA